MLADGFMNWSGGVDFFTCNLVALLNSYDPNQYRITILFPEKKFFSSKTRLLLRLPLVNRWVCSLYAKKNPWFYHFERAQVRFVRFGKRRLNQQLKILKADLALFCWSDTPIEIPAIGYYPDLQHKYYPHFFTSQECENRDRTIQNILSQRKSVLVNSLNAKKDLERFFPNIPAKVCNLPFSPIVMDTGWLDSLSYDVKKKYEIRGPYFMVSNQFWIHKDFKTAFEALSKLNAIHLVCTGKKNDFRFPGYYEELLGYINKLGIQDRVHLLGYIPKREQVELMKGAVAVIQPSLFEGGPGGGAINTAVAIGVPSIVSNITVNLEIQGNEVQFFERQNSVDLCEKMQAILNQKNSRPPKEFLLKQRKLYLNQLGDALLNVVKDAL